MLQDGSSLRHKAIARLLSLSTPTFLECLRPFCVVMLSLNNSFACYSLNLCRSGVIVNLRELYTNTFPLFYLSFTHGNMIDEFNSNVEN